METNVKDVTLLAEVQIQARVLVPVLAQLRKELGNEKAMSLIKAALRELYAEEYRRQAEEISGTPLEKVNAMNAEMARRRIGNLLEMEWIEKSVRSLKLNVTKCGYAEFFKSINECELGAVMSCERDMHVVNAAGKGMRLLRKGTIMEGADCCDFHYIVDDTSGP